MRVRVRTGRTGSSDPRATAYSSLLAGSGSSARARPFPGAYETPAFFSYASKTGSKRACEQAEAVPRQDDVGHTTGSIGGTLDSDTHISMREGSDIVCTIT